MFFLSSNVSTNPQRLRCCLVTSDGAHLLAESRSMRFVLFTSGQRGTIPCRPTHPNATVRLMKSTRIVTLDNNLAFEPHAGFTIRRVNAYFKDSYFTCRAALDDVMSQLNVVITYRGK